MPSAPVVDEKDLVLALLGASAGLAGLVLVFLGVVLTSYAGFDTEARAVVRQRFQGLAWTAVVTFFLAVLALVSALGWMLFEQNLIWYVATITAFLVTVVTLSWLAVRVVREEFRG